LSGRLSLGIFILSLAALVTVAVIGKETAPAALPSPSATPRPAAALPSPSATPRRTLAPTPSPTPSCAAPRIVALVGAMPRHPRGLTPTGLATVAALGTPDGRLVPDRGGMLWSLRSGALSRIDPVTQSTRRWTYADDEAFAANGIVAARDGGVWLFGSRTVAWFDGRRFREAISAPGMVGDLAEAADGSIWAATWDRGVFRWDGGAWTAMCSNQIGMGADQISIGPAGDVWVANMTRDGGRAGFSRYDGIGWTFVPTDRALSFARFGWVVEIEADRTSGLIVAFDTGLARYDGTSWTTLLPAGTDLAGIVSMALADDGAIWTASGLARPEGASDPYSGVGIARVDARGVTTFGAADGLPEPKLLSWSTIAAVATTENDTYASTRDGLYRLDGSRWRRVSAPLQPAPTWVGSLAPVSRSEAWLGSEDGLWRIHDGRLTRVEIAGWPEPLRVSSVARGRDGSLAVATDSGVAVRRDGRWTVLAEGQATQATFDEKGAIWTCVADPSAAVGVLATYRLVDGRWRRDPLLPQPANPGEGWCSALQVDGAGGIWAGIGGWGTTFVHLAGDAWETVHPLGDSDAVGVSSIAIAPNGDVWATLQVDSNPTPTATVGRYDGSTWTLYGSEEGIPGAWANRVAVARDGSVWLTTDAGVARFDGQRWTTRFAGQWFDALAIARDGTVWLTGPSGLHILRPD
jgi:ligand-binding sensor domain-containing protein